MIRPHAPEEALHVALEGPTPADAPDELVSLAMRLRAIGAQIQAPESLRARRGALLALDLARARPMSLLGAWRGGRAVLIAAALTLLTVVGVAAATFADRWLETTGDENHAVPLIVPSPEETEEERMDGLPTDPSPVLDGLSGDGRDDMIDAEGEDATDDELDGDTEGEDADEPEHATDDELDGDTEGEEADEPEDATDDGDGDGEGAGLDDGTAETDDDAASDDTGEGDGTDDASHSGDGDGDVEDGGDESD